VYGRTSARLALTLALLQSCALGGCGFLQVELLQPASGSRSPDAHGLGPFDASDFELDAQEVIADEDAAQPHDAAVDASDAEEGGLPALDGAAPETGAGGRDEAGLAALEDAAGEREDADVADAALSSASDAAADAGPGELSGDAGSESSEDAAAPDGTDQTAWLYPSSSGAPHHDWKNPANAYADDGAVATAPGVLGSHAEDWAGFRADVSGAITGIEVRLNLPGVNLNLLTNLSVDLSWDGGKTYSNVKCGGASLLTLGSSLYGCGGATALWGHAWTPSEVNDPNLRVRVTFSGLLGLSMDSLSVKIHHALAP
jgi:hypothetical protein